MRKFYILTVFLAMLALLVSLLPQNTKAADDPSVPADAALLVEAGTGQILYEKNKDATVRPGGIAKVMALLIAVKAVEHGKAEFGDSVARSLQALNSDNADEVQLRVSSDETKILKDLLYELYLTSDNTACKAAATHIAGSVSAFVDSMNAEADRLGCRGTHFTNADGASDVQQYTTAWDQSLILREAVRHPLFLQIAGAQQYKTPSGAGSGARVIWNSNLMLYADQPHYDKFCIAGKTDDMALDKFSYVSASKNGNMRLISVIFNTASALPATVPPEEIPFVLTKGLFDWCYSNFTWRTVINKNDIVAQFMIEFAKGTHTIELQPRDAISVLTRADLNPGDIQKEIRLYGQTPGKALMAPVKEGQILGEVTVTIGSYFRATEKLVATRNIELDRPEYIKTQIKNTLSNTWFLLGAVFLLLLLAGYIFLVVRDGKERRERKRRIEAAKRKLIEDRKKSQELQKSEEHELIHK